MLTLHCHLPCTRQLLITSPLQRINHVFRPCLSFLPLCIHNASSHILEHLILALENSSSPTTDPHSIRVFEGILSSFISYFIFFYGFPLTSFDFHRFLSISYHLNHFPPFNLQLQPINRFHFTFSLLNRSDLRFPPVTAGTAPGRDPLLLTSLTGFFENPPPSWTLLLSFSPCCICFLDRLLDGSCLDAGPLLKLERGILSSTWLLLGALPPHGPWSSFHPSWTCEALQVAAGPCLNLQAAGPLRRGSSTPSCAGPPCFTSC
ncbi:hypothetical protein LR48_Vigan263s000200 [Vigna angularis]|uniref:Uncharacterized protein n=1 Tax=Phaseolus angularis TaxID=3914 RepID=A0A0L9T8F8_PHAAN|nr:hypothetical protein LR48_Vigan263s000200 [Vigna angularis]